MLDLAIRGGTVVTATSETRADVGIAGERIAEVGVVGPARSDIDARGRLVLPGAVDLHTHLGQGIETMASGTRDAAVGGVTTVLAFAQPAAGESLLAAAERAVAASGGALVDFAFHVVVTDPSETAIAELPELVRQGHAGLKVFMVMPQFGARTADYLRLLRAAGHAGALTAMHAEDAAIIALRTEALLAAGRTGVRFFPDSRPVEAEEIAVHAALGYSAIAGAPIYLVHLSSRRAIEALRAGRARGINAYGETRPLYLHLTREAFERPDGAIFVGQPPLRTLDDQAALWEALADGTLSTVGTDHFPHRRADKLDPSLTFASVRPGVANLRTLLPMLYSEGVRGGRISLTRLVDIVCSTPARLAGLAPRKGAIAVGADADLVILDPDLTRTVRSADLRSNADHDVFDGWEVTGWPVLTISRGVIVAREGEITGPAGHGRFTPRAPFAR